MRGLLIKDLKLMRNQKMFLVILILLGLVFLFTQDNSYTAIGYMTMMCAMFSVTTFTYDEIDNGNAYLFTLPFSRKDYVKEKYIFALTGCLFGFLISIVLSVITSVVKVQILSIPFEFGWMTVVRLSMVIASVCVLFVAASIPVEIKLGVEKGRIGLVMIMVIFFSGYYLIMEAIEIFGGKNPLVFFQKFMNFQMVTIAGIMVCIWVVVLGVSMLVSVRFINRKEY